MALRTTIRKIGLLVVEDGRLLVVLKRGGRTWILPGGKPEPGETDQECLEREIGEELGCRVASMQHYVSCTSPAADMPEADVELVAFLGTLDGDPSASGEIGGIAWLDIHAPQLPIAASLSEHVLPHLRARFPARPSGPRHRPKWKVHLPLLINETLSNPHLGALKIPYRILQSLLQDLVLRAARIGDVELDSLMIRLALYAQGDPHDEAYAPDSALHVNQIRVRELHGSTPETEQAIERAQDDEPGWEPSAREGRRVHDWRTHVGEASRRTWPTMPFASRVAVALDAERLAANEEWD